MNFIKINIKTGVIFLGLYLASSFPLYPQKPFKLDESGVPLIQNFLFPDFCLSSGKFSVFEDRSGFFLIGAKDKIIVFYGNEFIALPLKGQINISTDNKSVFYSGFNALGLIKLFKNSPPQLLPLFNEELKESNKFGQINSVFIENDFTIFNNNREIFQFDGSTISLLDSSSSYLQLFKVSESIYVFKHESGLFKFNNGHIDSIQSGKWFAGKTIEAILKYGELLLIKLKEESEFIELSLKGIQKAKYGLENFIDKAGFTDAIILPGNKLVIGTKSSGLIIYDFVTKKIRKIGIDEGLLNNTVKNIHVDKAGNLWIFHDIGISRIELNIPVTEYGHFTGISGYINDIVKYKGTIYLATSSGLLEAGVKNILGQDGFNSLYFKKVEEIISECIKLFAEGSNLIVATPTGFYVLKDNSIQNLYKVNINCAIKIPFADGKYLIGNDSGLFLFQYSEKYLFVVEKTLFKESSVLEVASENDTIVWFKTGNDQIIMLTIPDPKNFNITSLKLYDNNSGFQSEVNNLHIFSTGKGVRFCNPNSILAYNFKSKKFENEFVSDLKQLYGIPWIIETKTDRLGNRWFHVTGAVENLQGVLMYNPLTEHNVEKPVFFNTGSSFSPIYIDSSVVWIGGRNKLLRFDSQKLFNLPRRFSAIVKRVRIGKDSSLNIGLEDPEINFKYNTVKFEVASTCFEGEPYVRYQYKLDGYNNKWSSWLKESVVTYKKLANGKYIFKTRALNVDGIVSDETELKFYILPPFYRTYPAYGIYFLIFLFAAFILLRWRTWVFLKGKEKLEKIVMERTEEILKEKEKSELLIANLLPKGTADELKSTGKATSQKFSMATVLFSDIQGFTKIAEQMNPELLIDQLDAFFFHFDMVVEKYNIEKIKTIGDAYMCAGGIPNKNITNPVEVVLAALEMQEYMRELKSKNADIWDLRIGIHTGSVIAGVVGHKKLSYDIWGDTVNTASRMESSGEAGKINISGHTFELVKDFFICEHRGKMPVKYKGEIDMYFVKGIRPELAVDMKYSPNKKFFTMLQLLRLQDVEEVIFEKLGKELPENLYFHNVDRMKEIYNLVDLFGRAEGLTDDENLLLRTAALLHDIGYIWSYDNHEDSSITFTRELLPKYKYSQEQIDKIIEFIEVTKGMRKPVDKAEEILLDADLNYLARADFVTLNDLFFKELNERGKAQSKTEWNNMQIVLLSNHKFYNRVANVLRDVSPEQQIENLIEASKKTG
jgi:adenylate cyclase